MEEKYYRFGFEEIVRGYVEVRATSLEEAREMAEEGDWTDKFDNKSDFSLGNFIDSY